MFSYPDIDPRKFEPVAIFHGNPVTHHVKTGNTNEAFGPSRNERVLLDQEDEAISDTEEANEFVHPIRVGSVVRMSQQTTI